MHTQTQRIACGRAFLQTLLQKANDLWLANRNVPIGVSLFHTCTHKHKHFKHSAVKPSNSICTDVFVLAIECVSVSVCVYLYVLPNGLRLEAKGDLPVQKERVNKKQRQDGWGDNQHNVHITRTQESHRDNRVIKTLITEQFSEASISAADGPPPCHTADAFFCPLYALICPSVSQHLQSLDSYPKRFALLSSLNEYMRNCIHFQQSGKNEVRQVQNLNHYCHSKSKVFNLNEIFS